MNEEAANYNSSMLKIQEKLAKERMKVYKLQQDLLKEKRRIVKGEPIGGGLSLVMMLVMEMVWICKMSL